MAAGRGQSRTHASDFGLDRAGENHADRVQQDELGMLAVSLGDRFPRRAGDEVRELFDDAQVDRVGVNVDELKTCKAQKRQS